MRLFQLLKCAWRVAKIAGTDFSATGSLVDPLLQTKSDSVAMFHTLNKVKATIFNYRNRVLMKS